MPFRFLIPLLIWLTCFASCASTGTLAQQQVKLRTKLVLLGTGTPNAEPDRSGPCLAVVVDDTAYLVDAGPGLVRRAGLARSELGLEALKPSRLGHVFLTHLHSDHTVGLPDLIFTCWTLEREKPLQLFGPKGSAHMVNAIQSAWREDIAVRKDGLEPANLDGHKVDVHELQAGVVFKDERVQVTAIAVPHGEWEHAFGYRFDTPDRSIVISGDCTPNRALLEAARGCDILVHEVYSARAFAERAPVWQRYHATAHTSTDELAAIAAEARPGLLVLTHQLYWGATERELLAEIQSGYDGPIANGSDLSIY